MISVPAVFVNHNLLKKQKMEILSNRRFFYYFPLQNLTIESMMQMKQNPKNHTNTIKPIITATALSHEGTVSVKRMLSAS